jgi:hypothetical protein
VKQGNPEDKTTIIGNPEDKKFSRKMSTSSLSSRRLFDSPKRRYEHSSKIKVLVSPETSGRIPLNYSKLEKALQEYGIDTLGLQFGRHLQRKRGRAT